MAKADRTCPTCGKTFVKPAHMRRHFGVHEKIETFQCSICAKLLSRADALVRHARTAHSGQQSLQADEEENVAVPSPALPSVSFSQPEDGQQVVNEDVETSAATFSATVPPLSASPPAAEDPSVQIAGHGSQQQDTRDSHVQTSESINIQLSQTENASREHSNTANGPNFWNVPYTYNLEERGADNQFDAFFSMLAGLGYSAGGGTQPPTSNHAYSFLSSYENVVNTGSAPLDAMFGSSENDNSGHWFDEYLLPIPEDSDNQNAVQLPALGSRETTSANTPFQPKTATLDGDDWSLPGSTNFVTRDGIASHERVATNTRDTASPRDVLRQLNIEAVMPASDEILPSETTLEACIQLYFRDFHPCHRILHRPTWNRKQASPLLIASVCSIGYILMGTEQARANGIWMFHRIRCVVALTWDEGKFTERQRFILLLVGCLTQCIAMLLGTKDALASTEMYHAALVSLARGLDVQRWLSENALSYTQVALLDEASLDLCWTRWFRREMCRRAYIATFVHAAELAVTTGTTPACLEMLTGNERFSDALFEAEDARQWRSILAQALREPPFGLELEPPIYSSNLFHMSCLSQEIVRISMLDTIAQGMLGLPLEVMPLQHHYKRLLQMASAFKITTATVLAGCHNLKILWHYCCLIKLSGCGALLKLSKSHGEANSGKSDSLSLLSVPNSDSWLLSARGRLAVTHCCNILHSAHIATDLAMMAYSAIFHALHVVLAWLSHEASQQIAVTTGATTLVTDIQHVDWTCLASALDLGDSISTSTSVLQGAVATFVAGSGGRLRLPHFFDSCDPRVNAESLKSTVVKVLRRNMLLARALSPFPAAANC